MRILLGLLLATVGAQSANAQIALPNPLPNGVSSALVCPGNIAGVAEGYRPRLSTGGYGFCIPTACKAGFESAPINGKCVATIKASWASRDQSVESVDRTVVLNARVPTRKVMNSPVLDCSVDALEGTDFELQTEQAVFSASSNLSSPILISIKKPAAERPAREIILGIGSESCVDASKIKVAIAAHSQSLPALSIENASVKAGETASMVISTGGRVLSMAFATPVKLTVGGETKTVLIPKGETSVAFEVETLASEGGTELDISIASTGRFSAPTTPAKLAIQPAFVPELRVHSFFGGNTTCVVGLDFKVKCTGVNGLGQMGIGADSANQLTPVLTPYENVAQLAMGSNHSVALLQDGRVLVSGDYKPSSGSPRTPIEVAGLFGAKKIYAANNQTMAALMPDGKVLFYGSNNWGSIGLAGSPSFSTLYEIQPLQGASSLMIGAENSCGIFADGTVKCAGRNTDGRLGVGHTNAVTGYAEIAGFAGAKDIQVGNSYICAHMGDDTIKCSGDNFYSQMGPISSKSSPTTITGYTGVKQLAVGTYTLCAVVDSVSGNKVFCSGRNNSGQFGVATPNSSSAPFELVNFAGAKRIAHGQNQLCAVMADDKVKCSGANNWGQLGVGDAVNRTTPTEMLLN